MVIAFALMASEGDFLTSEEDILDALSREEINFTQYYDILELFRDKVSVFGDDIDRLEVIPGVDRRWIAAIRDAAEKAGPYAERETFIRWFPYDFDRIAAFVVFDRPARSGRRGGAKFYTHGKWIEDDIPTTNTTFRFASDNLKFETRVIDDEADIRCRRRKVEFGALGGEFTLGSFSKGFGNGLILGKAFHVQGAMRENSAVESMATPKDNLFNGLRYEGSFGKVDVGLLFSRSVYDSISVGGIGAELGFSPRAGVNIGGVFAHGNVAQRPVESTFEQNCGSIFTIAEIANTKARTEVGFSDGEMGLELSLLSRMENARALIGLWSYSENFHPLHGDGESDYRETDIELGSSGVVQDSRQAGESGVEVKINAPLSDFISIDLEQSGWRTPINADWGLLSESGLYYRDVGGRRVRGEFSWEKRTLTSGVRLKQTLRLSANWPIVEELTGSYYFRFRWTTADESVTKGLSAYAEIISDRFDPLEMRVRIRRSKSDLAGADIGYWELRFRDDIRSGPMLWNVEVRHAIYDRSDKTPLTEFRITCGWTWR